MYKHNEIVPIKLENNTTTSQNTKGSSNKLALRIKKADEFDVLIYNGANNYILQMVLKELMSHAL